VKFLNLPLASERDQARELGARVPLPNDYFLLKQIVGDSESIRYHVNLR
jgi:hypothetical protein